MKYTFFALTLMIIAFVSCDNELDLLTEFKEVPVVYGVIDQADTAQYIRVERVFVDPEIPGPVIAKDPDSLYYDNITVRLVRKVNGESFTLQRVDGNLEGYQRDEGAFADAPNYLYKIKTSDITLNPGELIGLEIEGVYEDRLVTAETTVLEKPFFVSPLEGGTIALDPFFQKININWNPKGDEEQIFTVAFNIFITETLAGQVTEKELRWVVHSNTSNNGIDALRGDFFNYLTGQLDENPDITRTFDDLEFELIAGGQSVSDYIRVGQANLGITSSGEIPTITNLSDGLGLFGATITDLRKDLNLSTNSRDSLVNSQLMEIYNFE